MDEKPSFRLFLPSMLLLLISGWGGLALILNFSLPTLWPRWAFFALIVMAFTGTALPVSFLLNERLMSNPAHVVTRQAIWVGIYAAILAWLQIGDTLNFPVALWLVLGFLAIEYLIQLRERPSKSIADDE
jgi:hypothetical protein